MRLKLYEASKPELKDGQYAVPMAKKDKFKKLNPNTNRMKNSRSTRWYVTDVAPKDRTFKNIPRYANKECKCRWQDWLEVKGGSDTGPKGCDGKFYGWSHRAVFGFGVGQVIKPGHIGNKYQYGDKVSKEYERITSEEGYEVADKYYDSITFEPYTIKTEEEAKEHAIRFARGVS